MHPRIFLLIAVIDSFVLSVAAALATEWYVTERVEIIGSFMGFQKAYNEGVAFGITFPPYIQEMLIGSALILVAIMAIRSLRGILSAFGFGMIIGGGFANIVDRLPDGRVTDVFQVGSFPIFNVADSFITVGVVLLLWEMVRARNVGAAEY